MKRHVGNLFVLVTIGVLLFSLVGCDLFDMFGSGSTTSGWGYPIPGNTNFKWKFDGSVVTYEMEAGKSATYIINGGVTNVYGGPFPASDGDFVTGDYNGEAYAFTVYPSDQSVDITATVSVSGENVKLAPSPIVNEIDVTTISLEGPSGGTIQYSLDNGSFVSGNSVTISAPSTGFRSHTLKVTSGDSSKIFGFKLYATSSTVTKIPCLIADGGTSNWFDIGSATRTYKLKGEGSTTVIAYTTGGEDPTDTSASNRLTGTGEINFSLSSSATLRVSAQTPGKSWSPIVSFYVQNSGSQIPNFYVSSDSGATWNLVSGSVTLPYGSYIEVRGVSGAKGQTKIVLPGQSVPTSSDMNLISEVTLPYSMTATNSCLIAARARLSGESWSKIVSLTVTVVGASTSSWTFPVSFTPAGGRPLYIKRLSSMSTTSSVAETICDGTIQTSVTFNKSGWYKIGAGSDALEWLHYLVYRLTIGSLTSPSSLAGFALDNEGHYQWFVTIKNDGTIVNGLTSL